jgi:periodic tryptophan protein 1
MITTTSWVRRGVAAQFPTKYEIDEEEINRISNLARMQLEDAQGDLKAAQDGDEEMDEDKEKEDGKSAMKEDSGKKTETANTEYVLDSSQCVQDSN